MAESSGGNLPSALEAAVSAQFVLVAIVSALKARTGRDAYYYLAGLCGVLSFMLAGNLMTANSDIFSLVNPINALLELSVGPLLLFYLRRSQLEPVRLKLLDFLHIAPVAIGALFLLLAVGWLDYYVALVLTSYVVASWFIVVGKPRAYDRSFYWFAVALLCALSVGVALRAYLSISASAAPDFREDLGYATMLGSILAAVWLILFVIMMRPEIINLSRVASKYAQTGLSRDACEELQNRLAVFIQSEQPYFNPELTIDELATAIDVKPRHLSQVINTHYKMNFSAFLNVERVKAAAQKLSEPQSGASIKAIMYNSGFRSKTAFNREFKKIFGVTPSEYREQKGA